MQIKIDRNSRTPMYIQIRNQIRAMIFDGRLRPGSLLPRESWPKALALTAALF